MRTTPIKLFLIAMVVNVGMWLERFVIVVTSLHRDFLPSSWGMYWPTRWDLMTFFGTIGLFVDALLPVHPGAADDLDLRDADDGAGREGEGRRRRTERVSAMDHTPAGSTLYGLMAEFEDPTSLVEAARRTYDEGYRRFDSFSPFPIHEVFERDAPRGPAGAVAASSAAGSRAC